MAAPEHVPTKPTEKVRAYVSNPRRPEQWRTERPADFADDARQPQGPRLGHQGPDQGYALKLANDLLVDELHLQSGEHRADAIAGVVAVALKRASSYGRAPVIHDLRIAATIFGFLDASPDPALVELRRDLFEEVAHPHHYMELRGIVDMVPEEVLRQRLVDVTVAHGDDWRTLLVLPADA